MARGDGDEKVTGGEGGPFTSLKEAQEYKAYLEDDLKKVNAAAPKDKAASDLVGKINTGKADPLEAPFTENPHHVAKSTRCSIL